MSVSFIVIFFKQFNKCRLYNIRMYDKLIKGIIKFIENWFLYKRHMHCICNTELYQGNFVYHSFCKDKPLIKLECSLIIYIQTIE